MKKASAVLKKHPLKFLAVIGFILLVSMEVAHPSSGSQTLIGDMSPEQRAAAARLVIAEGYDCVSVYAGSHYVMSNGFTLTCLGSSGELYQYEFENHGGKWSITAD